MKPKTIIHANKTVSVILVIITVITFSITNYSIQGSTFDKIKGSPIQTDFQSNLAINDEVFEVGFWEKNLGRIDNVYVNNSLAYISGGDVTLAIANITDTTEPAIIGTYESEFSSSYSTQLYQLGDIMFIAKGSNGLDVVNISNPYAPTHIGHRGSYSFRSIAVKDHYMFSADLMLDLRVFNLINLSNILLTTTKNEGSSGSYALELVDNYVYLANGNDGLKIYNVTYPTLPEFVSKIDIAGTVYTDIEVLDNIAYILDSADHILTFNVSDVTNPVHLGTYNGTNYSDLFLNNNYLYVTQSNFPNGFEILNCTNPELLTTVHLENYEGVTTSIYVTNNESYITDWNNGIMIYDLANITSPQLITEFGKGLIEKMTIYDDYACLLDSDDGLIILNITDSTNPIRIASYNNKSEHYSDIFIRENLAFLTSYNSGLSILNITDTSNIELVGQYYDGSGNASGVFAIGSRAFIADGSDGLEILDITNLSSVIRLANSTFSYPTALQLHADTMYIQDGFAYVVDQDYGFFIVDVRDGANQGIILDSAEDSNYLECVVVKGFAYITTGTSIALYNVLTPESIILVEVFYSTMSTDICIVNEDILLGAGGSYIKLFDITITNYLFTLTSYDATGTSVDIATRNGFVFRANGEFAHDFQILLLDYDEDGLSDIAELEVYGTDPTNPDTDYDDLGDAEEIIYGTDPLIPDSDFDGLKDGEEVNIYGTDPLNEDTDEDGYSDGDEIRQGSDPLDPNSIPRFQIWMVYVLIIAIFLILGAFLAFKIIRKSRGKK